MNESKSKSGGATTPSHVGNYQRVAARSEEIFATLFKHLTSRNESVSLGAAKVLANKILPDLKSIELGGEMGDDGRRRAIELLINVGRGFLPTTLTLPSTPDGSSTAESTAVQSPRVASKGTEDLHSNNGDIKAGAS